MTALSDTLSKEKDVYFKLLLLAEVKKDVLIKNDINALNDIVKKEVESLKKLKALEKKRTDATVAACAEEGCAAEVSCLLERLEGGKRAELEAAICELADILRKLSDANRLNQKLLETHLKFTAVNIQYLSQERPEFTYRSTGHIAPEPARTIIDQKV